MKTIPVLVILACVNFSAVCFGRQVECELYTRKSRHSTSSMFLASRDEINPRKHVRFYLFTRRNPSCTQELKLNDRDILIHSNFNPLWPTRFIIHGWKNDLNSEMNDLLRSAYLFRGYFNVIIVDWGDIAYDINYDRVAKVVNKIGAIITEFILFLHNSTGLSYDNIYLIGHSLGAHIAGSAGYNSIKKINTIIALDPAEPYFKDLPLDQRIDASDAKYVEGIHTDISLLGFQKPIGHADFYPNYGKRQPGCEHQLKTCSHSRAYKFFAETINSKEGFWAMPCQNVDEISKEKCLLSGSSVLMGGEPAIPKKGIFYLPVNNKPPFSKGKFLPV